MDVLYPEVDEKTLGLIKISLFRIPKRFREDAFQEMWVAHLEGRCPINAIGDYGDKEALHEGREATHALFPQDGSWDSLSPLEHIKIEQTLSSLALN